MFSNVEAKEQPKCALESLDFSILLFRYGWGPYFHHLTAWKQKIRLEFSSFIQNVYLNENVYCKHGQCLKLGKKKKRKRAVFQRFSASLSWKNFTKSNTISFLGRENVCKSTRNMALCSDVVLKSCCVSHTFTLGFTKTSFSTFDKIEYPRLNGLNWISRSYFDPNFTP